MNPAQLSGENLTGKAPQAGAPVIKADTVVVFQSKDARARLENSMANQDMSHVLKNSNQDDS